MTVDRLQGAERNVGGGTASGPLADGLDRLVRFDGPPQQFLVDLLAYQCALAGASGGALLRRGDSGGIDILALHPVLPAGTTAPVWLSQAAELAARPAPDPATAIRPVHAPDELYGQPPQRHLVIVPIKGSLGVRGVAAFLIDLPDGPALARGRERLELTINLLSLYEMRLALQRRQLDLRRMRTAMDTLAAVGRQERFAAAGMALCNEIASRWGADRVSLGFLRGRAVRVRTMSHSEKFSRKMKLVQDIEAAMEECLDQDVEVTYPFDPQATFVGRAAGELSKRYGPSAVISLPLRKDGEPAAVVTVERPADTPFSVEDVETLRVACDLCSPQLASLHAHDRWFGARLAGATRKGLAGLVGPRHTWIKLLVLAVLASGIFLAVAKGDHQAEASFAVEAARRHIVPAPFDGYLESVGATASGKPLAPGEPVEAGQTILATLDTSRELLPRLAQAKAERLRAQKQVDLYRREGRTAEEYIAQADVDKANAAIRLLEQYLGQATLVAPSGGIILTGEWDGRIGTPLKTGDVLFEIAPLEALRAELHVPEDQIADVRTGQEGELATVSYPDHRIRFTVERISPVAEVVKQQNVFKVRARLAETPDWLKPGMEGVARINIDRRTYAWLWSHRLVNWIRMKLWL